MRWVLFATGMVRTALYINVFKKGAFFYPLMAVGSASLSC